MVCHICGAPMGRTGGVEELKSPDLHVRVLVWGRRPKWAWSLPGRVLRLATSGHPGAAAADRLISGGRLRIQSLGSACMVQAALSRLAPPAVLVAARYPTSPLLLTRWLRMWPI